MPAWLDVGLGILGATGQAQTNRANRDMSREQMRFQERMSSTAAQRSVLDYTRAGLNPALAYDRPASSPGGSAAQMGDVIAAGISSGQAAARAREELKLIKEQKITTRMQGQAAFESANKAKVDAAATRQEIWNRGAMQPAIVEKAKAEAALTNAMVPGAEAEAKLWQTLDKAGPVVKALAPLMRIIRPR